MADYKESSLSGTKYQRACRIMIENPLGKIPRATFVEEEVTIEPDGVTHKLAGSLSMAFDPNELVTMIDPLTNEPTEIQYPVSLAQWIIYSLYWKKTAERDAKAVSGA